MSMNYIEKLVGYAAAKHGRVQLIGFSDGQKMAEEYIKKYGDAKLDRVFTLAGNPIKTQSSVVTVIIGD